MRAFWAAASLLGPTPVCPTKRWHTGVSSMVKFYCMQYASCHICGSYEHPSLCPMLVAETIMLPKSI